MPRKKGGKPYYHRGTPRTVTSFCRACGEIMDNVPRGLKYHPDRPECQAVKREKARQRAKTCHRHFHNNKGQINDRPWTSGCVDNLWRHMMDDTPIPDIRKETRRSEAAIIQKMDEIMARGIMPVLREALDHDEQVRIDRMEAMRDARWRNDDTPIS